MCSTCRTVADPRLTQIAERLERVDYSPIPRKRWWNVATAVSAAMLVVVIFLLAIDGGRLRAIWQYMEPTATEAKANVD